MNMNVVNLLNYLLCIVGCLTNEILGLYQNDLPLTDIVILISVNLLEQRLPVILLVGFLGVTCFSLFSSVSLEWRNLVK